MKTNVLPTADRLVVKRLDPITQTAGGIFIPDQSQERAQQAKVIAVGPGRREDGSLIPVAVNPGDVVFYGKHAGAVIKIMGEEFLILSEKEVFAIIEETESEAEA